MEQMTTPTVRLSNGIEVPQLGFGVSYVLPEETQELVEVALAAGHRHIDLTASFDNEAAVGAALANAWLPREEYFVTVRLCDTELDRDSTLAAFEASLERLGLDHIDLYMLDRSTLTDGRLFDAWRAFGEILREEAARAIGVSNFRIEDLVLLEAETTTRPVVNQVELHPWHQQGELRAWHAAHGILTTAWSPLAQGAVLDEPAIVEIANAHGKTPAQTVLRWHAQLGNAAIPRGVAPEQIREHIDSFGFELSEEEMATIGNLDRGTEIGFRPAGLAS
ncbi:MAG TPA: aldo/keto reductase [Solirubrobacterales bacterium]